MHLTHKLAAMLMSAPLLAEQATMDKPIAAAPNGRGRFTGIASARRAARKRRRVRARAPKGRA
jgi:hypothetical protein